MSSLSAQRTERSAELKSGEAHSPEKSPSSEAIAHALFFCVVDSHVTSADLEEKNGFACRRTLYLE